jgi:alpha/beta hydrolase fold
MPGMPTELCREADLSLRGPDHFVRPRISWPPGHADSHPIAVLLSDADSVRDLADALCAEGFLVLDLRTAEMDVATIAVEWAADHGHELGGDPERLLVIGGRLAAAVALHARDERWPRLARQVLIGPDLTGWPLHATTLAGVAPATVVNGGEYANRLREAGVEVQDLYVQEPMSFGWVRGLTVGND